MSERIEFSMDRASEGELLEHLKACDAAFVPPLGERVDLDAYAGKIVAQAVRFEAWANGQLIGLVAAYCNDSKGLSSYITSVSVLNAWTGQGIAGQLLRQCAGYATRAGFRELRLEVGCGNEAAIHLYKKLGLVEDSSNGEFVRMSLKL